MALSVFLDLLNGWSIPSIFLLWLIKNTKLQTTSIVVKVGKGQPWMLFGLFPEGFYWRRVFTIFSSLSNIIHTHIPANSIYLSSSNNLVMVQCLIHVFFYLIARNYITQMSMISIFPLPTVISQVQSFLCESLFRNAYYFTSSGLTSFFVKSFFFKAILKKEEISLTIFYVHNIISK